MATREATLPRRILTHFVLWFASLVSQCHRECCFRHRSFWHDMIRRGTLSESWSRHCLSWIRPFVVLFSYSRRAPASPILNFLHFDRSHPAVFCDNIVNISSMTQYTLVTNIKQLKIRRHVSAHWAIIRPNTNHSTGTFSECVHYGIPYCLQNYNRSWSSV